MSNSFNEETMDPDNWDAVRKTGHRMLDDMMDYLSTVNARPAWQSVPADTKHSLDEPLPSRGIGLDAAYDQFLQHVLPYPTGNQHPGFFGWVMGNGTVSGMLADMLASGMNPHLAGYDQSAALVEKKVIEWLAAAMDFPQGSSGLLVTGGTMANLNALAVARHEKSPYDIRQHGLQHQAAPTFRVYGSAETHSWILTACELMGMGRDAFVAVPTNDTYQIDIDACRRAIERDLADGLFPFCVMGTAGTVNTAAIDDMVALRALADEFDLWFHIDGAFGSMAALSATAKPLVAGQELADSIAFDLHKWGYLPYDVGCVLVRHRDSQVSTFGQAPSYLTSQSRGVSVDTTYFADRGIQLSRSFRALKVWMTLKEVGVDKIGRLIQQNIDQAAYLESIVAAHPRLEVAAPVSLNIVCIRYTGPGAPTGTTEEILLRLQEAGRFIPSHTVLDGDFAIRVCIANHRTKRADLDDLVRDIVAIGDQLASGR